VKREISASHRQGAFWSIVSIVRGHIHKHLLNQLSPRLRMGGSAGGKRKSGGIWDFTSAFLATAREEPQARHESH
jgi:hypothetical protein